MIVVAFILGIVGGAVATVVLSACVAAGRAAEDERAIAALRAALQRELEDGGVA